MNIENLQKLKDMLDVVVENERGIKDAKQARYWYPLNLATYGTDEMLEALDSMCSFRTSMGEKTRRFEHGFSRYQGCTDAVMVNSGSSADLLLGLLLTNPLHRLVNNGDEVIVPVVTWVTQVWSMMMAGLKVKLADVNPLTLNVDLDDLEACISERTRVLFLVHLMGNPCDMDRIQEIAHKHKLLIIEDCCEAIGATWSGTRVGNFGVGGAFSFSFSHQLCTMDGGMVAVNDAAAAEHLRIFRNYGCIRNFDAADYNVHEYADVDTRYDIVNWGVNVRPTEAQAAFGIRQIEKANGFVARRAHLYNKFSTFISSRTEYLSLPQVETKASPSWLGLPLMVHRDAPFSRREITSYLDSIGVESRPMVAGSLARHRVAARFPEFRSRDFDGADEIHKRGFFIGLSPVQTDATMDRLVHGFSQFLAKY